MNRQPYGTPPRHWDPKLSPRFVRLSRRWRRDQLTRNQQIDRVEVFGQQHLVQAASGKESVLITPNHSTHYDSASLYLAVDQIDLPIHFMSAWQVFAMSNRWECWSMQHLGCFSIDRESSDRRAYKLATTILQESPYPLVIFPEGDIFHLSDRVLPFREGAAAIALSAARRGDRPVSVVPCAIRFFYIEDPTESLLQQMQQLESRFFLRTDRSQSLPQRIYRFAEAILSMKEIDYLGRTEAGPLPTRISTLAESIVSDLERRHAIRPGLKRIPERVKELRQRLIKLKEADPQPPVEEFEKWNAEMDDLFFVMQIYSYPGDYLITNPTIEQLAETLDKFEEDVFDKYVPSVRGRRRVEVHFGEPLRINAADRGRDRVAELTADMQSRVQCLLDETAENRFPLQQLAQPAANLSSP